MSYAKGIEDTPLHALERAVQICPDATYIDFEGDKMSFWDLDVKSTRLAHELMRLGIQRGDRIVSILETSLDVYVLWFAASKVGAIWVPINLAYRQEFLRHQIVDTGAKLVLLDADYLERVIEIADKLPEVRLVLSRAAGPYPACRIAIEPLESHRGSDDTRIALEAKPSDVALIIYTSGTTGPSKGCMLSHNLLCHLGRQQIAAQPHGAGRRSWTCLPLFHMTAITGSVAALVAQNGMALARRFSVTTFWDSIEQSGATGALLMASIFPLIALAPDNEAMKRCRGQLAMIVGVPVAPEIRTRWMERFGVGFVNTFAYGQTEGCRLSTHELGEPTPPEGSAGRIASEFEVMIFDDDDNPVPDGTIGEIVYRPRFRHVMFEGYWGRPDDTLRAWRNMWMHTGDLGRLEKGYLFFMDRKKDYLRSRGENISSFEVEKTYAAHPDVVEVAVHSVGDKAADDQIKVTLIMAPGATTSEEQMCLWSIDNLPHFAVPRYYEFRRELPKNPTGRVLKYRLRDDGVTERTWDREVAGIIVRRR